MIKQKIWALLLVVITIPCIIIEGNATATVFMLPFACSLFFSKKKIIF